MSLNSAAGRIGQARAPKFVQAAAGRPVPAPLALKPADPPPGLPVAVAGLCIILVALSLRPGIVSIGPVLPEMIREFGLSHTQASLLTAIPTVLMGLFALPAPWLARRYGRNRVILAALMLLAAATLARAFAGSVASLFVATAGIGAGIAVAGALIAGFVKSGYPRRAAPMMGVYATALAFGSTAAAATTGLIAGGGRGWRPGAGFWALPVLLGIAAWLYIETRERAWLVPAPFEKAHRLPVGNLTAWLVALFFACNNFVFYGCVSWIAPIYVELGRAPSNAGLILASFTLAFMVSNPIFGILSRNEDRRMLLAASSGIALTGIVWMAAAPNAAPFVAVPVIAFGAGGAFTLAMTLPLDNASGPEEANAWNAFVMLLSYLIAAAGPLLVGYLRDVTGTFRPSLWLMVAVSAAMLATTPFLQPYRLRLAKQR